MSAVIHLMGVALAAICATLLPPILIAFALDDTGLATRMSLLLVLGGLLAALILQSVQGQRKLLRRLHSLFAVLIAWITCAVATTAFMANLFGLSIAEGAFEAVSAITTTGQSVLGARSELPTALLFWRVELEWFGGLLVLVCLLQIVAPAGLGGLPQFTGRLFTKPSEARDPRMLDGREDRVDLRGTRAIASRFTIVTLVVWVVIMVNGPEPLDALMLTMTAMATGGFLFFDGAPLDRLDLHTIAVMGTAFLLGATSIIWQRHATFRGGEFARRNLETLAVLGIAGVILLIIAVRLAVVSGRGAVGAEGLVESFFTAASLVATSGLETRPGIIALLPAVGAIVLVFAGASLFSTTGGVKLYRVASLFRFAERELTALIYPHSVSRLRIGGRSVAEETLHAIWAYFVFAVAFLLLATFALAMGPFNFEAGFNAAASLFTSAGPLYDALRPPTLGTGEGWPSFADLSAPYLLLSCFIMLLGRLEILIVFAVLNIRFWMGR